MVNTAVNNNIYAGRKPGSKYNQSHTFQQKEVLEVPDGAAVFWRYLCHLHIYMYIRNTAFLTAREKLKK